MDLGIVAQRIGQGRRIADVIAVDEHGDVTADRALIVEHVRPDRRVDPEVVVERLSAVLRR